MSLASCSLLLGGIATGQVEIGSASPAQFEVSLACEFKIIDVTNGLVAIEVGKTLNTAPCEKCKTMCVTPQIPKP